MAQPPPSGMRATRGEVSGDAVRSPLLVNPQLDHHLLDVIRCAGGLVVRTGCPIKEPALTVGKPALVPLGQSGTADAALVGDMGERAARVDALTQAAATLRGERSIGMGGHSCSRSRQG